MPWDDLGTQDPSTPDAVHPASPPPHTATEPLDVTGPVSVHAAGAVLWRQSPEGRVEVAVVHRPRYDDWSLPKGKLDPGETIAHAASREVVEETGFSCALSQHLGVVRYTVPKRDGGAAPKRVDYFAARAGSGVFHPNSEVDELRWLTPEQARARLTYAHDETVLDAFGSRPMDAVTLLLVRHAKAGSREDFRGDDTLRPLNQAGLRQQRALHSFLPLFGPEHVHAAPRLRCEQSVQPVAADLDTTITREPRLSEEGYRDDPEAAVRRLLSIAAQPGISLVCSQGGVIPDLVARLARSSGLDLGAALGNSATDGGVPSKKASTWALTFRPDRERANGSGPPLWLAAADYHPEPDSET